MKYKKTRSSIVELDLFIFSLSASHSFALESHAFTTPALALASGTTTSI
jgi:hypothetical protein